MNASETAEIELRYRELKSRPVSLQKSHMIFVAMVRNLSRLEPVELLNLSADEGGREGGGGNVWRESDMDTKLNTIVSDWANIS